MEQKRKSRDEIILQYRSDVEKLIPYISWLQTKSGKDVEGIYAGEGLNETSVPVPVYDANLLRFVREAGKLELIDRNYVYVYARYDLDTIAKELKAIEKATLQEMKMLSGILSKYVLKGRVQGKYWTAGVENHIFLNVILKMKELMEFWDKPLA